MDTYLSNGVFIMKQILQGLQRLFSFKKGAKICLLSLFLITNLFGFWPETQSAEADFKINTVDFTALSTIQGNSLLPISGKDNFTVTNKMTVIITAYSSTVGQTDSTPFITASNTTVRDGIVANNLLPFGTRIRIPELYGDKIFIVEDRMHSRKGNYHVDIWFPTYEQAKEFGARIAKIEVVK
jgi:3D (Asp-Asp-Asp) domain-containing protein